MILNCEEAIKERMIDYAFEKYQGFDSCGYCGSMNPVELAELIETGKAIIGGSDWKYGFPHKFYVKVINPEPDKLFEISYEGNYDEDGNYCKRNIQYAKREYIHLKFRSNHLALLDNETFDKVAPVISKACGIEWYKKDGEIYYKAPYHGYQKSMY